MFRNKVGDGGRGGQAGAPEQGPGAVPGGEGGAGVDRRTVAKSAALAAALLLAGGGGVAQARTTGDVTVRLPAPTGPHRIGLTTLYLVDGSRPDPWVPEIPVREVMVSVFYPARTVRDHPLAPQMTEGAAGLFPQIDPAFHEGMPASGVNWAATMTHAHTGAPAQAVRRPVLLYSPGGGDPRTLGTGVAEELASRGYVVVTIDHPGDTSEVEFPTTTAYRKEPFRTTVFRDDPRTDPQRFRTVIDTRIADTRFVLDQLEVLAAGRNPDAAGRPLPADLGRALDLRRVGVYGHSAGGTTAAETLYEDRRIDAAINLEGFLDHPPETPGQEAKLFPVAQYGVDRPLLLLGTDGFSYKQELERSWSAMLAHSRGCTRRRQLDNATHWVFTDYAAIAPQLQAAGLMTAGNRIKLVGAIDPAESVPAVRHYVHAFFARHLPSH
ncbi:alpha/beta hydrolase family protein [Streptomyces inhibens]|uniref:alpha/beta hydrolase family protein n=1 Tax=Streptomyces inhibens TaxID=2293571 RepID=UPI0036B2396B